MPHEIDASLEARIDAAGRQRAFDRAIALGWQPGELVPKYVWWHIVRQLEIRDGEEIQD